MGERGWRRRKATKREVLAFFEERGVVTINSLIDRFGYSYNGATRRIYLLHKEGLIQPFLKGVLGINQKGRKEVNAL